MADRGSPASRPSAKSRRGGWWARRCSNARSHCLRARPPPYPVSEPDEHPVAGHDDADRVAAVGESHGSGRRGFADPGREFAVGDRLSVGDLQEGTPDRGLERGAGEGQRKVEDGALTGEVLRQLGDDLGERCGVGDAEGVRGRPVPLVFLVEADECAVGGDQGQRAEGTVHNGVDSCASRDFGGHDHSLVGTRCGRTCPSIRGPPVWERRAE